MRGWLYLAIGLAAGCGRLDYDGVAPDAAGEALFCDLPETVSGTLDSSFGEGGILRMVVGPGGSDLGQWVIADSQNRILLGVQSLGTMFNDMAVLRLLEDGSPDPSWGTDGVAIFPSDVNEPLRVLTIDDSGRVLAGGGTVDTNGLGAAVVRFTSDGLWTPTSAMPASRSCSSIPPSTIASPAWRWIRRDASSWLATLTR